MRVLVVGAGEVGFNLARRLSEESQDVVLIEADPERAHFAGQQLDILTVVGNGASTSVLESAGVETAGMLLAVTSQDEVNLVACLAAKRLGVKLAVARISNAEYYKEGNVLSQKHMGIDLMINPERACAVETFRLLESGAATDVAHFAEGRVQLIGLQVLPGAPVAGKTLAQLGSEMQGARYVTGAVVRNGVTTVPGGNFRIEAGDRLYITAPTSEVHTLPPLAGYPRAPLVRVMIAGGSAEGEFLAQMLEEHGVETTILDRSRRRCLELAERLPKSLVLNADATDLELLEMEGVQGIDGFVAATGHDEINILSCLLAKAVGARKVVSLVNKFDYLHLVPRVGIDASVSPRVSTINAILRYVRKGKVMTVASLTHIDAEAIEFKVEPSSPVTERPLKELDFPHDAVVAAIVRGADIILPRGDDRVLAGDEVIVFALPRAIPAVENLFAG